MILRRLGMTLWVAAIAAPNHAARAHAIAGARVFPVTLTIDDPGVADEVTVPQLSYQRSGDAHGSGGTDVDLGFEYDKTITGNFGLGVESGLAVDGEDHGKTHLGWEDLVVTAKYQVYVNETHEFIVTLGIAREFGRTGSIQTGADQYGSTAPILYFGKGFGDLPSDALRPFAVTGVFSYVFADKEVKQIAGAPAPPMLGSGVASAAQFNNGYSNRWSAGFSVQYSLPYLVSQVHDVQAPDVLKHVFPLVEVAWSSPAATPSNEATQITVAPGFIWMNGAYQIGVEALIPANRATGSTVGVLVQFHVFLDELLPGSLGKPLAEW